MKAIIEEPELTKIVRKVLESDDIYKAITHWGTKQATESKFGDLMKKAQKKR